MLGLTGVLVMWLIQYLHTAHDRMYIYKSIFPDKGMSNITGGYEKTTFNSISNSHYINKQSEPKVVWLKFHYIPDFRISIHEIYYSPLRAI